jgi:hypothetical protein
MLPVHITIHQHKHHVQNLSYLLRLSYFRLSLSYTLHYSYTTISSLSIVFMGVSPAFAAMRCDGLSASIFRSCVVTAEEADLYQPVH